MAQPARTRINQFPGAVVGPIPPRCPDDGGPWARDETGVHCMTCRTHYVVMALLLQALRHRLTPERTDPLGAARGRRAARGGRQRAAAP